MSAKGAPEILEQHSKLRVSRGRGVGARAGDFVWRMAPQTAGEVPEFNDIRSDDAKAVVEAVLARGGGWLSPIEIGELFSAAGIPVVNSRFVSTLDEAIKAAAKIGFPVALKATGPTIVHKTEVGGVALNLVDETRCDALMRYGYPARRRSHRGDSAGDGARRSRGGCRRHARSDFWTLVLYGTGGVLVELLNDVAFRIHPLTDIDAREMINEVKGTALLRGYRGSKPADEAALVEIILRVSALLEICPQINEMDANPIKVLEKGAIVVDARVRVDRVIEPPPTRRIAY